MLSRRCHFQQSKSHQLFEHARFCGTMFHKAYIQSTKNTAQASYEYAERLAYTKPSNSHTIVTRHNPPVCIRLAPSTLLRARLHTSATDETSRGTNQWNTDPHNNCRRARRIQRVTRTNARISIFYSWWFVQPSENCSRQQFATVS